MKLRNMIQFYRVSEVEHTVDQFAHLPLQLLDALLQVGCVEPSGLHDLDLLKMSADGAAELFHLALRRRMHQRAGEVDDFSELRGHALIHYVKDVDIVRVLGALACWLLHRRTDVPRGSLSLCTGADGITDLYTKSGGLYVGRRDG